MNKKAITILGAIFLLIVGTLGFLIYKKKANTDTPPVSVSPPPTAISPPAPVEEEFPPPSFEPPPAEEAVPPPPEIQVSGAVKLTDDSVLSPVLFYQGNGIAYLNSRGQLFQADIQASSQDFSIINTRELVIPLKSGMSRILWPSAGNNFIAEFESNGRKSWSVYVSDQGNYVDLPNQVTAVNWMPSGDRLLYVWLDKQGKSTLNVANPDNTDYQVITDFWENDNDISVAPDSKNILFFETQKDTSPNKLNLVTADGKLFRSVIKEGYNTGSLWSPDSKKFAFLRGDSGTGAFQVWVGNLFSGETKNTGVYSNLGKVVWSSDSQSLLLAGGSNGNGGDEQIYMYSLAAGELLRIDAGTGIDVREPFLTSTGDKMLFRKAADGDKLYYVDVSG